MTRATIDFGIDLGTTNSAIAVLNGMHAEVIKNNDEQHDITPSAVFIDAKGRIHVGEKAKARIERDPANASAEFKLKMGTKGQAMVFEDTGRTMEPEQLSAEVLKSLKSDVRGRMSEEIYAAVITVPAAFQANQTEATRRAAQLAGLDFTPLIQEPTAAAQAYAFGKENDNAFWLVYDLGGGTFDAAVVQVRDEEFVVVNHEGDNFLGGKLIDWDIVETLLIPAVIRQHQVSGFGRGEDRWVGAIAKLKAAAEKAKIELSRKDSSSIEIEPLCDDDRGNPVDFEYELQRKDVERIAEPYYARSINICRKALEEKRLGAGDVEKVLLVGGPTLTPYLRERLVDPRQGLGIPLDFSQDPLTVVARGAAIFAATQRLPAVHPPAPLLAGQYRIDPLEFPTMGPEIEPLVGGVVTGDAHDLSGFTIEFVNEEGHPAWRSGKVQLSADGRFLTTLWAEKERTNTFEIILEDASGVQHDVDPTRLPPYRVSPVEKDPRLTHSIGIGLVNNAMVWFFEKGQILPCKDRSFRHTTVEVRRGQPGGLIRIPVMEGSRDRADRNRRVGTLDITPDEVRRDVPVDSEVEVTIEIDASRLIRTEAFVPVLDEVFEKVLDLTTETVPDVEDLKGEVEGEKSRLAVIRERVERTGDPESQKLLRRMDDERIVSNLDDLLTRARTDSEAAAACENRLLDLRAALDDLETVLEWPDLVSRAEQLLEAAREIIRAKGDDDDRRSLEAHEKELKDAMNNGDADLLRRRVAELSGLAYRVANRTGELDVHDFQDLKDGRAEMRDQTQADRLLAEGERAINRGDVEGLRSVNRQLRNLFPAPPPPPDPFSTVR